MPRRTARLALALVLVSTRLCTTSSIFHVFDNYPTVVMNACSREPHSFVGDDGSLLVRRVLPNDVGVQQLCDSNSHIITDIVCKRFDLEVSRFCREILALAYEGTGYPNGWLPLSLLLRLPNTSPICNTCTNSTGLFT